MPNSFSNFFAASVFALAVSAQAAEAPVILSRDDWQAKPPALKMLAHKPKAILVHHTGSAQKLKTTLAKKMQGLQRFSQAKEKLADGRTKPVWPDVPYHFYVAVDGSIAEGRNVNAIGDTNTGYDPEGYIQVVLEGNFESQSVTKAQGAALTSLLSWLLKKHDLKATSIAGHRDKAQTACPGKNLFALLPEIINALK
jgi:hypothetical protein